MGSCHSSDSNKNVPAPSATTIQTNLSSDSSNQKGVNVTDKHLARKQSTENKYSIVKVLGEGASCRVCSVREQATGLLYAMKIMEKSETYNSQLYRNEVEILTLLNHPNVLRLVEAYEDKKTYHIITQLCQGGELFDKVKNGSFSEKVASRLARELLQALAYTHSRSITHRDLKPENCIFADNREDSPMILVDFGCAKIAKDNEIITDVAGSPYYVAPEVLNEAQQRTGQIWRAADMWSVGVIIFLLTCGYPPFNGESQERIFKKIKRGKYRFPHKDELGGVELSESSKDLINHLLVMDPLKRLTAVQALNHPWIVGETAKDEPLPASVVDAISAFRTKCRLKKAVARAMINKMSETDKHHLEEVFKKFDKDGNGRLDANEIAAMMKHIGKDNEEGRAIAAAMDDDADGTVTLDEFQQAHAIGKLNTSAAEVKASFDLFDADKDGFVTHAEIERLCEFLTPEATAALIKEVDSNSDGKINFTEWIAAMTEMDIKIAKLQGTSSTSKISPAGAQSDTQSGTKVAPNASIHPQAVHAANISSSY